MQLSNISSMLTTSMRSLQELPLPSLDQKKHLPNKISDHVIEVNEELINLKKEQYGTLHTSSTTKLIKLNPIIKRKTIRKSAQILPVVARLSQCTIKPKSKTIFQPESFKRFNTTTSLPNPIASSTTLTRSNLFKELKAIDDDSSFVQNKLLSHMRQYEDQEKQMTMQFKKINTLKDKLIYNSDKYLRPDLNFLQNSITKHSNDFYNSLDKVIGKINENASIDLFHTMKMLHQEKEKRNSKIVYTDKKRQDRIEQLLDESNKINKRISKLY